MPIVMPSVIPITTIPKTKQSVAIAGRKNYVLLSGLLKKGYSIKGCLGR
jgi:hypothetical protein